VAKESTDIDLIKESSSVQVQFIRCLWVTYAVL